MYVCVCVMWELYTLSLGRSREHGVAVNCADRRNIAVVKVLSPAERVSSPPPHQGRWSGCCCSAKIPYPLPQTTLNSLSPPPFPLTTRRPFVCASFRTGTTIAVTLQTSEIKFALEHALLVPICMQIRFFYIKTPPLYNNIII